MNLSWWRGPSVHGVQIFIITIRIVAIGSFTPTTFVSAMHSIIVRLGRGVRRALFVIERLAGF